MITLLVVLRGVFYKNPMLAILICGLYFMIVISNIREIGSDAATLLVFCVAPALLMLCLYVSYAEISSTNYCNFSQGFKIFANWFAWFFMFFVLLIYPSVNLINFIFSQKTYLLNAVVISKHTTTHKSSSYSIILQQAHNFSETTSVSLKRERYNSIKIGDFYQDCVYIGILNIRYQLPHATAKPNCINHP